jgi:hypothetical protein
MGDIWKEGLDYLFREARERNLCFHCSYQDLWFTPDELKSLQDAGSFQWGVANWKLLKLPANKQTYRGETVWTLYKQERRISDRRRPNEI